MPLIVERTHTKNFFEPLLKAEFKESGDWRYIR